MISVSIPNINANDDWLSGYTYRIKHNITGSDSLTNYPMRFKVYYGKGNGYYHFSDFTSHIVDFDPPIEKFSVVRVSATEWHSVHGNVSETPDKLWYCNSTNGIDWVNHKQVITYTYNLQDPILVRVSATSWYVFCEYHDSGETGQGLRIYNASSPYGTWTYRGSITFNKAQSPVVWIENSDEWHLFYEEYISKPFDIHHATSSNGVDWVDDTANNPIISSGQISCPHSIYYDVGTSTYHLYITQDDQEWDGYNRDPPFHAQSTSITSGWEMDSVPCIAVDDWNQTYTYNPSAPVVVKNDTNIIMYASADNIELYNGVSSTGENVFLDEKSRTDFRDVRFTKSDNTLYKQYMDKTRGATGSWRYFYVNIPVLATGTNKMNIYFGDSDATEKQDKDTFVFFDDFETDLSKWNTGTAGGTVTRVTDPAIEGSYSCQLEDINTDTVYINNYDIANYTYRVMFYWRTNVTIPLKNKAIVYYDAHEDKTVWLTQGRNDATKENMSYYDTTWNEIGYVVNNSWYLIEFTFNFTHFDIWMNGTKIGNDLDMRSNTYSDTGLYLATSATPQGFKVFVDQVIIMKYAEPEPEHSLYGVIETTSVPPPPIDENGDKPIPDKDVVTDWTSINDMLSIMVTLLVVVALMASMDKMSKSMEKA